MELKGEELYELMPQRPPIVMVSSISDVTADSANSTLEIQEENIFAKDGVLREPGIVEHIAQSAACFAGYDTYSKGLPPKLGYIGEIKKLSIFELPKVGQTLCTTLRVLGQAAGVTLIGATVKVGETTTAEGQMKIFIKED